MVLINVGCQSNDPALLFTLCMFACCPGKSSSVLFISQRAHCRVTAGGGKPLTGLPRLGVRTALALVILVAAKSVPFLAYVMSLVGSFMTISVSVTFPALCHLVLYKGQLTQTKVRKQASMLMQDLNHNFVQLGGKLHICTQTA